MKKRTYTLEKQSESTAQTVLMTWAKFQANLLPGIDLLHAIPNGGHRHINVARQMKREGVTSGVPDLCLPVARGGHHGLYIEMKAEHKRPKAGGAGGVDPAQVVWLRRLTEEGYLAVVCWGWEEAKRTIETYLKPEPPATYVPTFRERFLEIAVDGRIRTVKHIRQDLGLSEGFNLPEALRSLQGALAAEAHAWRLRTHTLTSRAHVSIWWLEQRKETPTP